MNGPVGLNPDGPHSPVHAREAADLLGQAMRYLNHATHPGNGQPGLEYPSDAYEMVGSLAEATRRMPQLLGQLAEFMRVLSLEGRLKDTRREEAGLWARVVANDLEAAGRLCESLAFTLDRRHEDLSGLYMEEPGA